MWFYRVGVGLPTGSGRTLGPHPGPPRNRETSQLALRRGAARTVVFSAQNCFICLRAVLVTFFTPLPPRLWPLYHRLALSYVFGFENMSRPPKKKKRPSGAQPPPDLRDASHRLHGQRFSVAQGQQRRARSNSYACAP